MTSPGSFSYDSVPYPNLSHANTHPDPLAVMGILAGMQPAPVEGCRVLELGCAAGGNLMPMAYALPGSEFVGVDLSANQIADGQARLEHLGLRNVRLLAMDILDFDAGLGPFDYIIAHGVYSWVPPQVRAKVLKICRDHLAPQGIGFISYNTYPGWNMIDITRGIMRYYTREIDEPASRAERAREALRFFADVTEQRKDAYSTFIRTYTDYVEGNTQYQARKYDSALLHDELEEVNQPFFFYQFADELGRNGLQYLGDMCHYDHVTPPAEVLQKLRQQSRDLLELEQALDFYQNRTFRQTLVCRAEVPVRRKVTPAVAQRFWFSSDVVPTVRDPDVVGAAVVQFKSKQETFFATDHPCSKAAMLVLAENWPRVLAFADLLDLARQRLAESGRPSSNTAEVDANVLGVNLLRAFSHGGGLVNLHAYRPDWALDLSDKPMVSPVARTQALAGETVTTNLHQRFMPDGFDRFILPLLDGHHSREDLVRLALEGPVKQGALTLERDGKALPAADQAEALGRDLEYRLLWFAQTGLLVKA